MRLLPQPMTPSHFIRDRIPSFQHRTAESLVLPHSFDHQSALPHLGQF
jgi:hypothetical protein